MTFTSVRRLFVRSLLCFLALFPLCYKAFAQRSYKPASVLATGNWYKLSVAAEGVYRLDLPFLSSLGMGGSIPSAQIRLFGGSGAMLPEANAAPRIDDLEELAIKVEDGGDGQLNGTDFLLFYSPGPHRWLNDSPNRRFSHQKNLYTERVFYFLTIGGTGKRLVSQTVPPVATVSTAQFDERYFHELDTVNFLNSGKEWFGEELSALPGRSVTRQFALPLGGLQPGPALLRSAVAARSANAGSSFSITANNQPVQRLALPPIGTGPYDLFVREAQSLDAFTLSQPTLSLSFTYTPGGPNSQGWINWFEVFCRRSLTLEANQQLSFRDWATVGAGGVQFVISSNAPAQVWDVTEPLQPLQMATTAASGQVRFTADAGRLREYIAFTGGFPAPRAEGRVPNQNLHASTETDYFIVTVPELLTQAQRLADFHRGRRGLRTMVVTTTQLYHEFAAGSPDPVALRDFVKMHFDRYRAGWLQRSKYLLLFGKASFDYKDRLPNNTNLVPAYQSPASVDPLSTYTSDDFFGFLEDAEDINTTLLINTLDIGIGRVPVRNAAEAKAFVDKVLDYHSAAALGPWRTTVNFIADDEDNNLHLQDAEVLAATTGSTAPFLNQQKIYLDAFQQERGSAGGRYPQANNAVNNNIANGTLIWNYSGHGGAQRLAEEVVIDQNIVNGWNNALRLPLFITATCDFAPYDQPFGTSLGENLVVRPRTGAVALMTTTRLVFANSNRILNNNYLSEALQPDAAGRYKSLGEAVQGAKNLTYRTSGDVVNNRKFTLLGDPAMTLGFPALKVVATTLNGRSIVLQPDTLSGAELATIEGEVQDAAGRLLTNFTGTAYLSVFDKERTVTTLGNDAGSLPVGFADRSAVLFRGKASVAGGRFLFRFRLPNDVRVQLGNGKLSLYAENGVADGAGAWPNLLLGGTPQTTLQDSKGPEIKAYLNDTRFVNGGLTNGSPVLLLQLSDSSGINTGGAGIDRDISATLNNDNNQYFVLNNFYEAALDSYQQGTVRFQLPPLPPGQHTLKIKAWDVANNSSEYSLQFTVANNDALRLSRVLNYPNPFTTRTAFWFEHNYPGVPLAARVDIYTLGGKRIKTVTQTINTAGNRSMEIEWDGRDDWGERLGRGVYLYRLSVRTPDGKTADKWERIALLQ